MKNVVTVRDRLQALGLSLSKVGMWKAGNSIRDLWLAHPASRGELPRKELRQKAAGTGSHCFAVYPDWFIPTMDEVIVPMARSYMEHRRWLQRIGKSKRPRVTRKKP